MRYRCYLCPDNRPGRYGQYREFEADQPLCPGCGAREPAVLELQDVHLLLADPAGPIVGLHGKRWRLACQPKREVLAEHALDSFAASEDARATTCPSCRGVAEWRQLMLALPPRQRFGFGIDDVHCCG